MIDRVCELPQHYHAGIILLVMLFEAWLGKTKRTQSASILELIINLVAAMGRRLKKGNMDGV